MEVFLARQPVFTKNKKLYGYELLFRTGSDNAFPDVDGDLATTNLLSNLFFPFEFNEILGNKIGLVNFTKKLLLDRTPLFLPKEQFIIEVLEDIEPEEEILEVLALFKERGYTIALDDFEYHEKFDPMIETAKIIKFDLRATSLASLINIIDDIKSRFKVKLLAEKVETYEEFETALEMGFDLFQGYFFSKPEVISNKGVSASQMTKLKLINQISQRELDTDKIEEYIKNDAPVSFKLLKYANSAYFNRLVPIDTVKDAISYVGEDELRKFINVVVVSDMGVSKPNELIRVSIIRARMCEKFKQIFNSKFSREELFTLGLFSYMDALMDCSMEDILEHVSFSDKIKNALLGNDKEFSRMLDIILGFEKGNWDNKIYKALSGKAIEKKLPELYYESVKMANAFY